jgi:hypothetical protein
MLFSVVSLAAAGVIAPVVGGVSYATLVRPPTARADTMPSCETDLDLLDRKIRQDYAGYTLELLGARLKRFDKMKTAARTRARTTKGDACFFVLRDFVDWFADPHLFVYQSTRLDTTETARRALSIERRAMTEPEARAYFAQQGNLDPIEGIWYDRGLRVAVLPDSLRAGAFVAVVLSSDTSIWAPGAVRARLLKTPGGYDVDLSARNYAVSHLRAQIYRHVLLRLSPGIWGKAFPVAAADSGTLDSIDPHRPTLVMRGATPVFSVPSHDPSFKHVIDSLVLANRDVLSHADRMIIDLRGNEGGSSFTTEYLEPFVSTKGEKPDPFPGNRSMMLSSDDQIAYAQRGFGPDTSAFVRTLLARLRAAPGRLVPLNDPSAPASRPESRDWVVTSGPRTVGVLIDHGTVSASEVLVLHALRSNRATVFGAPTAGALDYQSVNIVRLSPKEPRWLIGYPTITRSPDLPAGGMRGRGIQPQIPLDLGRLPDPVAAVDKYLATQR